MTISYQVMMGVITFLFIVPGKITVFNLSINWASVTIAILSIVRVLGILLEGEINKKFLRIVIYLVVLFAVFLLVPLRNNLQDTYINRQLFVAILMFFAAYQLVIIHKHLFKDRYIDKVLQSVIIAGFANALATIVVFLFPDVGDQLYQYVDICEKCKQSTARRPPGFFYQGYATLSFFYAILLVISIVHFAQKAKVNAWLTTVVFLVFLLALVISGRSGQVILLVGCVYMYLYNYSVGRFVKVDNLLAMAVMFIGITMILAYFIDFSQYERVIQWAFEYGFNYYERGVLESKSTNDLFGMNYFLPDDQYDVLVGTGNFGRSESLPYIHSDVGYVLFIFGVGVLGMLLAYSFFFYILYTIFSVKKRKQGIAFLMSFLIISIFIANTKDVYYLAQSYSQILFVLLSLHIIDSSDQRSIREFSWS